MTKLPYLTTPGNLNKALDGLQNAATPPKVSGDFVKTILGISGGSGDNMTTFLKRIGFAGSDGSPTELYLRYRNPQTSEAAIAEAMKHAYPEIFKRNVYAYNLDDDALKGLIIEITGSAAESSNVRLTLYTFKKLNELADFDALITPEEVSVPIVAQERSSQEPPIPLQHKSAADDSLGINIGYTINLNLPETSDVAVFNAIFKSLNEHLLSKK
jgi:hypothetical protein